MTSPRRLRSKRRHPIWWLWKPCFCALVFGAVVLVAISSKSQLWASGRDERSLAQTDDDGTNHKPFPGMDLWPNDRNPEEYRHALQQGDVPSSSTLLGDSAKLRVALVRPVGRLGDVFVEFVTRVVEKQQQEQKEQEGAIITRNNNIELVPLLQTEIASFDNNQQQLARDFTMLIRLATLPSLLQASDVALTILQNQQQQQQQQIQQESQLSMDHVMDLMKREMRFQCHLQTSNHYNKLPFLTITLDHLMGFPTRTTKQVNKFLNLTPTTDNDNKKTKKIDMDDLALIVMDRVNAASALVQDLVQSSHGGDKKTNSKNFAKVLQKAVTDEVKGFSELDDNQHQSCLPLPKLGNNPALARSLRGKHSMMERKIWG